MFQMKLLFLRAVRGLTCVLREIIVPVASICALIHKSCISFYRNNVEEKSFEEMKLSKSIKDQTFSFDVQLPYDD